MVSSTNSLGTGVYPSCDPCGTSFSMAYCRDRYAKAGQPIAGKWKAVLEGIQADQDFIRILFNPTRFLAKHQHGFPIKNGVYFWWFLMTNHLFTSIGDGFLFPALAGFFSKQMCCIYCRALQWVYQDECPSCNQFLYTNFGRTADHRNTSLSLTNVCVSNAKDPQRIVA